MIDNDDLPSVRMSPFLMTAALAREDESVLLQDLRDFSRVADRKSGSREGQFKHLGALRQRHIRRLEPKCQRFLCIRDRFFLRVSRAGASRQLRENRRPALHFGIEFDNKAKLHNAGR